MPDETTPQPGGPLPLAGQMEFMGVGPQAQAQGPYWGSHSFDMARLRQAHTKHRAPGDLGTVEALLDYYNDTSTQRTVAWLMRVGMGVAVDGGTLQISLLRYTTDTKSVLYTNRPRASMLAIRPSLVGCGPRAKAHGPVAVAWLIQMSPCN